jgi:hypothetical protein
LKGKKIAESMAGQLGTVVSGFAGKLAVAGVGLATGGTSLLASQTVGRLGAAVATNGTLNRLANSGQDTDSVQQRMQSASNFRSKKFLGYQVGKTKLGQAIGGSIERGDFNGKVMTGKLFGATKNLGKTVATVNPLDATIAGTSIRRATGAIATAGSGKKPLAGKDGKPVMGSDGKPVMVADNTLQNALAKDYVSQLKDQTIKGRAIDIAGIRNEKNTITNNQTNAVNAGLNSNPLGSQPGTGTPAGSTPQTSPTNPPTNPPTGGVTTPNKNIPPVGVTVPNAPNQITPQTSSNLTQVQRLPDRVIKPSPLKPENLVISAENITINQPAKSATVDRPPAPVTIVDRFNKPITREPIIAPTTPSGSHAKNYLSGIQSIILPITNKMAPVIDTLKNINNDQQKITGVSDKQQV